MKFKTNAFAHRAPAGFALLVCAVNAYCSSVAITSSANPSTYGQSVTLTAAVSPSTATGTVTFYNGVTVLEIEPLSSGLAFAEPDGFFV